MVLTASLFYCLGLKLNGTSCVNLQSQYLLPIQGENKRESLATTAAYPKN